jgi:hypothetical protein
MYSHVTLDDSSKIAGEIEELLLKHERRVIESIG